MAARHFGVLRLFRMTALLFPFLYFVTPFTVLVPESFRTTTVFMLLMCKLTIAMFSFPCCTILLTNSASSLKILGTLNGVGVSISAIGRAAGPALVGAAFTAGVKLGYVIIPWWILAVLTILSIVPVFWIEETDGFSPDDSEDEMDEDDE